MSDHQPPSGPVHSTPPDTDALPDPASSAPRPLSKKAAKRAAKELRYAQTKLERRAREKEAKREKKRLKAEKRAAGELDEDDEDQSRRQKKRKIEFGGRVVVDLGFDSLMHPKEIKSLTSQLAFTHSVNKQAAFPFDIVFSSLEGCTFERLENLGDKGYKRWAKTEWWHEGLQRLWEGEQPAPSDIPQNSTSPSAESPSEVDHPQPFSDPIRHRVVYLTADSEDELTELLPEETYVIGGIVDHNRYKNLCLNKAKELGIRTAKLPIGRYLASMPTRKVLTVNQCFEILVKWVETRDWEQALYAVIPQRKFVAGKAKPTAVSEGALVGLVNNGDALDVGDGGDDVEGDSQGEAGSDSDVGEQVEGDGK